MNYSFQNFKVSKLQTFKVPKFHFKISNFKIPQKWNASFQKLTVFDMLGFPKNKLSGKELGLFLNYLK